MLKANLNRFQISHNSSYQLMLFIRGFFAGLIFLLTTPVLAEEISFQAAIEAALAHDSEYKMALATFNRDQEEEVLTRSQLLPSIDFSASYSIEDFTNIYTGELYDPDDPRSSGQLQSSLWRISLNQPLVNIPVYRRYKASQSAVKAAQHRFSDAEQNLVFRTTERYLAVLYNAQLLYLNKNIHEALSLKYQQGQRRSSLGVGDELELLELEARRDLAQADYLKARSDLQDEQTKLKIMTGKVFTPPMVWIEQAHSINPPSESMTEEEVIASAQSNRLYLESRATLKGAILNQKANQASNYPTLTFKLDYSERDSEDPYRESQNLTASINLSINLYAGGKTQASLRQAAAKVSTEKARAQGVLANSEQKISLAFARKKNLEERLTALKRSVQSSERYLAAAERGLGLHLRSQVDVLDARTQMLDVQLKLAEALNQFLLADLQLQYQSGRLSKDYVSIYDHMFSEATL